jgi:beta-lactamase class C
MMINRRNLLILATVPFLVALRSGAEAQGHDDVTKVVREAVQSVMKDNDVPGMAVGVTVEGRRYFFSYGVASRETAKKVTENTIFEVGSISKTFTATLASYAQVTGSLRFSDMASRYLPALSGTAFDKISLLDLGTYVAGGLPLQFPDDVTDQEAMMSYYRGWRPSYPPGAYRLYSNPSIGLFGYLTARSMDMSFQELMEGFLFPALSLKSTFIKVPEARSADYAFGYSRDGRPIRVHPGVLDAETYGVKTTAADMIQFLEANMSGADLDEDLRKAIAGTHLSYFNVGPLMQALAWEVYDDPKDLNKLLEGNSVGTIFKPNPVTRFDRPEFHGNVLLTKAGSTNGFGAYIAFAPQPRIGIVILANRAYPIPARVRAVHQILMSLWPRDTQTTHQ